jgi:hypothetical protein
LSPKYVYDLQREIIAFDRPSSTPGARQFNEGLFIDEAARLLYRHWLNKGEAKKPVFRQAKKAYIEKISRLGHSAEGAENVVGLLRIAAFIARESVTWIV